MFKKRVKARHEMFNSRLKGFGILKQAFRSTGPSHCLFSTQTPGDSEYVNTVLLDDDDNIISPN
jgi:hypothetical protein